jgi:large conductance mechanosensitive channel
MKDFKAFIMRGNVVDMAVGIIIGAAFGPIISTLVNNVIMPPIGLLLGKVDFANLFVVLKEGAIAAPYASLKAAQDAGAVVISYGLFINAVINFIIIAAVVFFCIVRPIAKMRERQAAKEAAKAPAAVATTKECPFCFSQIPIKATRCPNCTSTLSK